MCTPGAFDGQVTVDLFVCVGRILGTNNVKMSGFALRQAASVLLFVCLVFFPSTANGLTLQQRQRQFASITEIVHDTADHIVQGMRQAIPTQEWKEQHDAIVKGVLKQRDHIVEAFSEQSFLEISRRNGVKKPSVEDKAVLFRRLLQKFDSHTLLVELAEKAADDDETGESPTSSSITRIAKMWASFRRIMSDLAEFMYVQVARETYVGVGVEGYIGWKGALSSGIGPNLQFCWDGTGIFNHMVYSDDKATFSEVMKNYICQSTEHSYE